MVRATWVELPRFLLTLSLILFFITGCGGNRGDDSGSAFSHLTLLVAAPNQSLSHSPSPHASVLQVQPTPDDIGFITRLEVSISVEGMAILRQAFAVTADQQTEILVELQVSKGENRQITATAFNRNNELIFRGGRSLNILQERETATIRLDPIPIVRNPGDQDNEEGELIDPVQNPVQIEAFDPSNFPLTFGALNLPSQLNINQETGLITGTIACGQAAGSPFNVAVSVSNGTNTTTITFMWTVRTITGECLITVNSTADAEDATPGDGVCAVSPDECTLRAAIQEANALPSVDVILLPAGTYLLTLAGSDEDAAGTGDLDITGNLRIVGDNAATTIIDAGGIDRVFHIIGEHSVTIANITLQNGSVESPSGGGIFNDGGTVTLGNGTVTNNRASDEGGGIFNEGGTTTLINSTISNNSAPAGGGWYFQ